ncbi:AAA family ATPase [Hansschlegelia sp.]|uniref:AAA family ATPase n=1 Tax=Hansschlegelia sp. TaxID=2041892 RepID=UPI002C0EA1EB|nr:AAA family ATPase [Hansschlegelia sp.]HVI27287.1 AAA family ATPase [Hansschlegelia sp.]
MWRWQWQADRSGWTKVPFQCERPAQYAKANDSSTWSLYAVAMAVVRQGRADGIGYQLADDDIAALDLDDCRDPETGELAPWAESLIKDAQSYVEVTISGTGLRIIGLADGPEIHRKFTEEVGSVELYRRAKRFIVVTGLPLHNAEAGLSNIDRVMDEVFARHATKPVRQAPEPLTLDLNQKPVPPTASASADLPRGLADLVANGAPEGERSDQFHHAVGWLKDLGWTAPSILNLLEAHPRGIAAKYQGRLKAEVDRSFGKIGDPRSADEILAKPAEPRALSLHWHGDPDDTAERKWLVAEMIPETGKGLLSGQWGAAKTFVALDLAGCVMTGGDFAGRAIQRVGGVVLIAAEGANEVSVRLRGVVQVKLKEHGGVDPDKLERLPFAWIDECPPLMSKDAVAIHTATIAAAADRMRSDFRTELVLIIIDTLMAAAGIEDENDAAQGQKIMRMLDELSRSSRAFVLAVDHFGKTVETGTRGTSAKEAAADMVLALLGDKDTEGKVSNRRMAIRKLRSGATGAVTPFELKTIPLEAQSAFSATATCIVEWRMAGDRLSGKAGKERRWPPALRVLHAALINKLAEEGEERRPFGHDGPSVRTVAVAGVRVEFYDVYPADSPDPAKRADAKRRAFDRALRSALAAGLVVTRDIRGVSHIWPSGDEGTDVTSTPDRQDTR